ncbi:MAG: hypothetical protein WC222_06545 [Parachlamydiales bacterium]|jgi:hypothetical protein
MPLSSVSLYSLFEEIDSCLLDPICPKARLEPNLSGNFLYSNTNIVGKAYGYLHKWVYWITGYSEYRKTQLRGALLYASYSSTKLLKHYGKMYDEYEGAMIKRLQGLDYDRDELYKARWHLSDYNATVEHTYKRLERHPQRYKNLLDHYFTHAITEKDYPFFTEKGALAKFPFFPVWLEKAFQYIYSIFRALGVKIDNLTGRKCFEPILSWLTSPGASIEKQKKRAEKALAHRFESGPLRDKMSKLLPIVRLEHVSQIEFPLDELVKVFKNIPRTEAEEVVLTKWCAEISNWKHGNSIALLHEALASVHRALLDLKMDVVPLESMEYLLYYDSRDKRQRRWEETNLITGNSVVCGESSYSVDKKITTIGDNSYYSLEKHPDLLLRVPPNTSLFAFENIAAEEVQLNRLKIKYKDPLGRFALVEAPQTNLLDISWKSEDSIDSKDMLALDQIGRLVSHFISIEKVPVGLNPFQFCFCVDKTIKAWQMLRMGNFNFYVLVKFIQDVSQNNSFIYKQLMVKTGLDTHAISRYYTDLVEAVLDDQNIQKLDLESKYGIDNSLVEKDEFLFKVKQAWNEIRSKLGDNGDLLPAKDNFLRFYKEAILINDLPKDITNLVLNVKRAVSWFSLKYY